MIPNKQISDKYKTLLAKYAPISHVDPDPIQSSSTANPIPEEKTEEAKKDDSHERLKKYVNGLRQIKVRVAKKETESK